MKLPKLLLIALAAFTFQWTSAQNLNIIPEPYQITKSNGNYTLPKSIAINAPSIADGIANEMAARLKTVTGKVVYYTKNKPAIDLQIINDNNLGTEGYSLDINEKGIQIKANANAGLFYGWQTI